MSFSQNQAQKDSENTCKITENFYSNNSKKYHNISLLVGHLKMQEKNKKIHFSLAFWKEKE